MRRKTLEAMIKIGESESKNDSKRRNRIRDYLEKNYIFQSRNLTQTG